jgi:hypothetical protein
MLHPYDVHTSRPVDCDVRVTRHKIRRVGEIDRRFPYLSYFLTQRGGL